MKPLKLCWYGDVDVLDVLDRVEPLGDLTGDLLVELGTPSVLDRRSPHGRGAAQGLTDGVPQPVRDARMESQIVFAGLHEAPHGEIGGLLRWLRQPLSCRSVVALIHVARASDYAELIGYAQSTAVLWNVATPANRHLELLGQLLDEEDAVVGDAFRGLLPYVDPKSPPSEARLEQVQQVVSRFSHVAKPVWCP